MDGQGTSEQSVPLLQDHAQRNAHENVEDDAITEENTTTMAVGVTRQGSIVEGGNDVVNEVGSTMSLAEGIKGLAALVKVTFPFFMTSVLLYLRSLTSTYFLSRLGKMELAGGSLALAFGNLAGFSVITGLSAGMDPICAQARGADQWAIINRTYWQMVCMLLFVSVFFSCLWLNAEPFFWLLSQDAETIKVAKAYLVCLIPELIAEAHLYTLRCLLRYQGKTIILAIASLVGVVAQIVINYLLVIPFNMGVICVGLTLAGVTVYLNIALVLCLVFSNSAPHPWNRSTFQSFFQGWWPLLCLAIPTAIGVCLEWWCYEFILLVSSFLDDPQSSISATSILIQTSGLLYIFPHSLSTCLTTILGAKEPSRAKGMIIAGILLALVYGVMAFLFTVVVRSVWGMLFTSEEEILGLISSALPLLGLCEVFNSLQTAASGALTGTARPNLVAGIYISSFYLIGGSVISLLIFKLKLGFGGLWFALALAQLSCACMMLYTLYQTDWIQQVNDAQGRIITEVPDDGGGAGNSGVSSFSSSMI